MSLFADQMLVQWTDSTQLLQLLAPADDPTHAHVRTLLNAVYDFPYAQIHDVRNVTIQQVEFQRPLFPPARTRGTWTQTVPSHTRTEVAYERTQETEPVWVDVSAHVALTLILNVDAGEVERILTRNIDEFATLDEFREAFRFIDLDAFMREQSIADVEELKARYRYLLTEIRMRAPQPFDPADPANQHRYMLNIALVIRDVIDVVAALRDAKFARATLQRTLTYRHTVGEAEVRTPYAPIVLFPSSAVDDVPFTRDELREFFARENVLVLFASPP